jgi:hypothetical protein
LMAQNVEGILGGHDTDVNYGFEHTDTTSLLQESMDSQRMISFCQPLNVSYQNPDGKSTAEA